MVEGDRDLLFEAIANLLDNAVKFSPERGCIAVRGETYGAKVRLVIEDRGSGVAAELRERITERFFRGLQTADLPGAGLSLALVAAVASFHEAPVRFASGDPGLRIEWDFPRPAG